MIAKMLLANSKYIKALNVRPGTIKFLKKKPGKKTMVSIFVCLFVTDMTTKAKIKWYYVKLENLN